MEVCDIDLKCSVWMVFSWCVAAACDYRLLLNMLFAMAPFRIIFNNHVVDNVTVFLGRVLVFVVAGHAGALLIERDVPQRLQRTLHTVFAMYFAAIISRHKTSVTYEGHWIELDLFMLGTLALIAVTVIPRFGQPPLTPTKFDSEV